LHVDPDPASQPATPHDQLVAALQGIRRPALLSTVYSEAFACAAIWIAAARAIGTVWVFVRAWKVESPT
jgi:hypothetical protein